VAGYFSDIRMNIALKTTVGPSDSNIEYSGTWLNHLGRNGVRNTNGCNDDICSASMSGKISS
jgi:hypothetical protein